MCSDVTQKTYGTRFIGNFSANKLQLSQELLKTKIQMLTFTENHNLTRHYPEQLRFATLYVTPNERPFRIESSKMFDE